MLTPEQQASDETTPIVQLRELAEQNTALARLVAGNFGADSELLRTLAEHDDCVVQQLVAANPNVPLDVLEKLAKQYPRQVLNNPAIDLFLLEKPDLLAGLSLKDVPVPNLIKRSLVSPKFLDYAARLPDEKVQMAIAMNPETSREILEQLVKSQTIQVVEAAGMHINWNEEISRNWRPIFQRKIKTTLTKKREKLKTALRRCKTEKLLYTKGVASWHPSEDEVSLFKGSLVHRLMFLLVWITIAFIFVVYAFLWIISSIATLTVRTVRLLRNLEDFILRKSR
jgi:hypothetical protein